MIIIHRNIKRQEFELQIESSYTENFIYLKLKSTGVSVKPRLCF